MKPLSLALLQSDAKTARGLASSLCHHFTAIYSARSIEELRELIVRYRTEVVILDMEVACLSEVERLHRDFTGICIVCTHRLADEDMWTAAMNAGAADICSSDDVRSIVTAALRSRNSFGISAAA